MNITYKLYTVIIVITNKYIVNSNNRYSLYIIRSENKFNLRILHSNNKYVLFIYMYKVEFSLLGEKSDSSAVSLDKSLLGYLNI